MNIQELRIGNYVLKNNAFICAVKELHKTEAKIRFADDNHDIVIDYEYIKPIPLTEDILLKCGFYECIDEDVNGYKKYINDDHLEFDVYLNSASHCCVHYLDVAFSNHPQSLHSLQNAIFALRGEELNIEL